MTISIRLAAAVRSLLAFPLLGLATTAPAASHQTVPGTMIVSPPLPRVGSENTVVTIEPRISRPTGRSCRVELFARREFVGGSPVPIAFAPPADCPGPWARVILEGDFEVTAGRQYDRSARVELAGINLFTGTTMEPRPTLAPRWSIERDVTDYAAVLTRPQTGTATLVNFIDEQHRGRIFWTARLVFHAADATAAAAPSPDIVLPIAGAPTELSAAAPLVERSVTLPRNVYRLAIDILSMPQRHDEFWQECLADPAVLDLIPPADRCGVPFRESEVYIDGRLAGMAPVFPWVYTGGMGVWNWTVIPGIETPDLRPYRVDLTPFAAVLNDGRAHRIALSVRGARDHMATTATLLAWRDPGRMIVSGALVRNTLAPSRLSVAGRLQNIPAPPPITVTASRRGEVAGYVDTSRGRIRTRIVQRMHFDNRRNRRGIDVDASQVTALDTRIVVTGGTKSDRRERRIERFALAWGPALDGRGTRRSTGDLDQSLFRREIVRDSGGMMARTTRQSVAPRALPDDGTTLLPNRVRSTVSIRVEDSRSGCYARTIVALNQTIAAVDEGC